MLRIEAAGAQATIQDLGRPGSQALGLPVGGAVDRAALAVANLLLGNDEGAPAIEITAGDFRALALGPVTVALAGADLGARIEPGGRHVEPGRAFDLGAGDRIALDGPRGQGLRAYLALPGGVAAPRVLGSASTLAIAGIGGLHGDGRPLAPGDALWPAATGPLVASPGPRRLPPELAGQAGEGGAGTLRVLRGPHGRAGSGPLAALLERAWTVAPDSDRMGLRLRPGPAGPAPDVRAGGEGGGEGDPRSPEDVGASFPLAWGAVQAPPSGEPIVLLCDHQTVGGYPVPAVVIRADLDRLGQLRPGDPVRFRLVTEAAARAATLERQRRLELARRVLREPDAWAALAAHAGA